MTCQDSANVTIAFPNSGLEIRPYTVDFRIDRNQLDFLEAKFSAEVGDYLAQFTSQENHSLRKPQHVEVKLDGEVSHRLFYRPDFITQGETNTWIEFHDPLKILEYDIVDFKTDSLTVNEIYFKIITEANTHRIIDGASWNVPRGTETEAGELERVEGPGGLPIMRSKESANLGGSEIILNLWKDYDEEVDFRVNNPNSEISQTIFRNLDIQNQTALDAIFQLNEKLGLTTWVSNDGTLNIGFDFLEPSHHVASANDERVWVYRDPQITPPGTPVKMAVVNGGMIDAPNRTQEEDAKESIWEFINPTKDHEKDLVAQGVAQIPGILDGKIVSVNEPNLARNALADRAQEILANEVVNNNAGSVRINVEKSGTKISDWRGVEVGDFITLIPSEDGDCKSIEQDVFLISGIRHSVDGETWDMKLQIQKWMKPNPTTKLRYFSPDSNNYYKSTDDGEVGEEIYTDS